MDWDRRLFRDLFRDFRVLDTITIFIHLYMFSFCGWLPLFDLTQKALITLA